MFWGILTKIAEENKPEEIIEVEESGVEIWR